jgi:predicted acylesterase/phospholipase RssA
VPDDGVTELRLALVFNGGVSLAVWMSGVVAEIELICRASRGDPPPDGASPAEVGHHAQWREITGNRGVRLVVDIVAGTSAGGINGAILATTLACGKQLPDLKEVWNTSAALTSDALLWEPGNNPVPSILDGDFFETAICDVLKPLVTGRLSDEPPDVTLFITATALGRSDLTYTDAAGERFDVADHRRLYCFRTSPDTTFDVETRQFSATPRNDFAERFDALVRGARASASFPAAFAPVKELPALDTLRYPPEPPATTDPDEPPPPVYLIDGGILDNAPIEPVIDEISRRVFDRPIERLLAYIVPSNGVMQRIPEDELSGTAEAPNWVSVIGSAIDFPRESDFRHDVGRLADTIGTDRTRAATSVALLHGAIAEPAARAQLSAAVEPLLGSYRACRIQGSLLAIRADLAQRRRAAPVLRPAADVALEIDAVQAAWVPASNAYANGLAADPWLFGFSGAVRTLRLLMRSIRERMRDEQGLGILARQLASVRTRVDALHAEVLKEIYGAVRANGAVAPSPCDDALVALANDAFASTQALRILTELMREGIHASADSWALEATELGRVLASIEVITGAAAGDSEGQDPPSFEFVRLGPDVGSALYPHIRQEGGAKLYGTSLGHFGAFGEARWRACDYTWGRLDAAAHAAMYLKIPHDQRRKLEEQIVAAEGWSSPANFESAFEDAGKNFTKTLDKLRSDKKGRLTLQGVADSVLRFVAQPGTPVTAAGELLRVALERGQRPSFALPQLFAWVAGVAYARRKLWGWLRSAPPRQREEDWDA